MDDSNDLDVASASASASTFGFERLSQSIRTRKFGDANLNVVQDLHMRKRLFESGKLGRLLPLYTPEDLIEAVRKNDHQAVKDLLEKRSRIYSSRPELYLAWVVLSSGLRTISLVRATVLP